MAETLETLQIELTAKVDQVQASLETVVRQLTGLSSSAEKAGVAVAESGQAAAAGLRHTAAAAEEATLAVRLFEAATGTARSSMLGMAEEAGALGSVLGDVGGELLVVGAALGVLAEGIKTSLEHSAEAELSYTRLSAVIIATGGAAGVSANQIAGFATETAEKTLYTKEQVEDASAVMLTFGAVTGESFERAMKAAEDLSAVTGQDLTSSVRMIGRALEDPVNGLTALRRAGILLTDEQKEVISSFLQTGDKAGALNAILGDIEGKAEGVADALGGTLTGAAHHAKTAFAELAESVGNLFNYEGRLTSFVQGAADHVNKLAGAIARLHQVGGDLPALSAKEIDDRYFKPSGAGDAFDVDINAKPVEPTYDTSKIDAYNESLREQAQLAKEAGRQQAIDTELLKQDKAAKEAGMPVNMAGVQIAGVFLSLTNDQIKATTDYVGAKYDETQAHRENNKEVSQATKNAAELKKGIDDLLSSSQHDLLAETMDKASVATDQVNVAVAKLTERYGNLTDAEKQSVAEAIKLRDEAAGLKEFDDSLKKIGEQAQQQQEALARYNEEVARAMNKPWENAAQGIQNALSGAFTDLFSGSINTAKDAAKAIEEVFVKLAAQLAVLQIFGPQISGLSAGGFAAAGTEVLPWLQKAGSSVSSLGGSGLTSAIGSSINNYGSQYLGTALPWQSGATATGILGAAGIGYVGGSLLSGLLGGSKTGGGIGGGLGTAAGFALGGPVGGAIGGALGSLAGGALGSLFGGKPSDKTAAGSVGLGQGGVEFDLSSSTGKKADATNIALRNSVLSYASSLVTGLNSELGTAISQQLSVQIGSRDGDRFRLGASGSYQNFGTDSAAMLKALTSQIADLATAAGGSATEVANLKTAAAHIDFTNTTTALADVNFALNFDHLGDAAKKVSDVDTAVAALDTTFDGYRQTAERLGLSVAAVNAAQQKQLGYIQADFMKTVSGSVLNSVLPGYSDIESENERYTQSLKDASKLGLNNQQITEITLEHQLNIKSLLASNNTAAKDAISSATTMVSTYTNLSNGFTSLLDELVTGDLSTASPTANLDDLRSQVEDVGAQAQSGDTGAQSELLTLIPEFLKQSASVNGYNASFVKDQALATSLAQSAKSVADQQLTVQQRILDASNSQTNLLEQIAGKGTAGNANDKLVAAIKAGYTGLTTDQIDAIFQSAGVTVAAGNGRRTAALNSNAAANTSLNDVFHALGVPGFATGGAVTGGKPGVDSVPLLAMPGEDIIRARAVASIGLPTLNYINATGRLPSNDNGRMDELGSRIDRLTSVVYAGQKVMNEHLEGIRSSSKRTAANTGTF